MLPFLKPKKLATTIISKHMSNEPAEEQGEPAHKFMAVAESMIRAMKADDTKALAECLEELQEIDQAIDEEKE